MHFSPCLSQRSACPRFLFTGNQNLKFFGIRGAKKTIERGLDGAEEESLELMVISVPGNCGGVYNPFRYFISEAYIHLEGILKSVHDLERVSTRGEEQKKVPAIGEDRGGLISFLKKNSLQDLLRSVKDSIEVDEEEDDNDSRPSATKELVAEAQKSLENFTEFLDVTEMHIILAMWYTHRGEYIVDFVGRTQNLDTFLEILSPGLLGLFYMVCCYIR
jgi:hypothetical protein